MSVQFKVTFSLPVAERLVVRIEERLRRSNPQTFKEILNEAIEHLQIRKEARKLYRAIAGYYFSMRAQEARKKRRLEKKQIVHMLNNAATKPVIEQLLLFPFV